jgi:hypothetical protein
MCKNIIAALELLYVDRLSDMERASSGVFAAYRYVWAPV